MSWLLRIKGPTLSPARIPIGLNWKTSLATLEKMETATIIGLTLFVISEILPYTPLKGNGIVQAVLEAMRKVFPHESDTE